MKKLTQYAIVTFLLILAASSQAKIIVVNTVDNANFNSGVTNLVTAINALADGDTIAFNIPGTGVHQIDTPAGGYPLITKNNVTIDGYTQPTAVPNSNPIHAANNAQIKILLSSTNGNCLSMEGSIEAFAGVTYNNLGFGYTEMAILGFFRGTNALVRGLAIQSAPQGTDGTYTGDIKSIAFCPDSLEVSPSGLANCANWRVSGCWWGLDPVTGQLATTPDWQGNGPTVWIPAICIAAYRTRNNDGSASQFASPATIGVAKNSGNPSADFDVIIT